MPRKSKKTIKKSKAHSKADTQVTGRTGRESVFGVLSRVDSSFESSLKVLIVGANGSGKSTVFKQVELGFGFGLDQMELEVLRVGVYRTIIQNLKTLITWAQKELDFGEVFEARDVVLDAANEAEFIGEVGTSIEKLWAASVTKEAWSRRPPTVADSLAYFLDDIQRIAQPQYTPTPLDYMHMYVRSTLLKKVDFSVDGDLFTVYDIGDPNNVFRNGKKREFLLAQVTSFVFTVALSEFENGEVDKALELYLQLLEIAKNTNPNARIVLLFTKIDIAKEKLARLPFRVEASDGVEGRFTDYQGPTVEGGASVEKVYENVSEYIRLKFILAREDAPEVKVFYLNATEEGGFNDVLFYLKDQIHQSTIERR